MTIFNCDTRWPLCLFDFTYKNKIPEFLCFRTSKDPPNFIDDYFDSNDSPFKKRNNSLLLSSNSSPGEGLMMERGIHHCCDHKNFTINFKKLFNLGDNYLYNNKNLIFAINEDRSA